MKHGRASRTAELVCMGRALAHQRLFPERYADPTALTLLPGSARDRVERMRRHEPVRGALLRLERAYLERQANLMVARTVAIDDAVPARRSSSIAARCATPAATRRRERIPRAGL